MNIAALKTTEVTIARRQRRTNWMPAGTHEIQDVPQDLSYPHDELLTSLAAASAAMAIAAENAAAAISAWRRNLVAHQASVGGASNLSKFEATSYLPTNLMAIGFNANTIAADSGFNTFTVGSYGVNTAISASSYFDHLMSGAIGRAQIEPQVIMLAAGDPRPWHNVELPVVARASFAPDDWDRAIQELYDALSDWPPEYGSPPADTTICVIESLIPAIRISARLPSFEMNDDGSITLRWKELHKPRSFAFHFGRRLISAILSEPNEGPGFAESLSLGKDATVEVRIVRLLQRKDVAALVK